MKKVKMKNLFKYEKIVTSLLIPIVGLGANYIKDLRSEINHLQEWKIQIQERDTPSKLVEVDKEVIGLSKDLAVIQQSIDTLKDKQDNRSMRNNLKFDEHEKLIRNNAVQIAYLKGACKLK